MKVETPAFCRPADNFLRDDLDGMSGSALLGYFQTRAHAEDIRLSPGKERHVVNAQALLENEFGFNNEVFRLGDHFDWTVNPSRDIEWLILLHKFYYFKDLAGAYDLTRDEIYAQKWVAMIESWIRQVPDGFIDSQVTGRRLQQWILSYHYFVGKWRSPSVGPVFIETFLRSVLSQTHYLCEHLTPEGNHRTLELYAVFLVAVTFPEFRASDYFLAFSTRELIENIRRDLLPDGVHRELSTDYHHTVLKNYLRFNELAVANRIELPSACDDLLRRAIEFSCYVHKPDGFIPAINDGDCTSYLSLLTKAGRYFPNPHIDFIVSRGMRGRPPVNRSAVFEESGYVVLRDNWNTAPFDRAFYLFFDCAAIGFGTHGHYDALSFEMAAFGRSLIVDPGRYTYNEISEDGVNWRKVFKGTAGHNTVVVDGRDQIPYRAGRPLDPEPAPTLIRFVTSVGFDFVHGRVVSPYYSAVHERAIFFKLGEYWIVTDWLGSSESHRYDLYFHLSARAQDRTRVIDGDACRLVSSPNLLMAQPCSEDVKTEIEQGFVSPEYGVKYPAPVVKFTKMSRGPASFYTVLYPYQDSEPSLAVALVEAVKNGRQFGLPGPSVLVIDIKTAGTAYRDYYFVNYDRDSGRYDFADIRFIGHVLFLRRDENGRIINLQGQGIEYVGIDSIDILAHLDGLSTVSYQDGLLDLSDRSGNRRKRVSVDHSLPGNCLYRGEGNA